MNSIASLARELNGPVLILGASGFVGANLMRAVLEVRPDVFGTASRDPAWRLAPFGEDHVITVDLLARGNISSLLDRVQPGTVFDCVAYGAYSFEQDVERMYQTNVVFKQELIEQLLQRSTHCYIHAGSSSEYGADSAAPPETAAPTPNSHYAVTKNAAASLVYFSGHHRGLRCANLRLYSVYGPLEDRSRLIPTLVAEAHQHRLPPFVDPETSRDFVYIDDVTRAFLCAAIELRPDDYGTSFNIGSGRKTTIRELAELAKSQFHLDVEPEFSTMPGREWDVKDWYANPARAVDLLGWRAEIALDEGLARTARWYAGLEDVQLYERASKKRALDRVYSVSAIIACYKDSQAIPVMAGRLEQMFAKLNIDHEIIFVNDGSPDDTEEVIRAISAANPHVLGITHSRNFGSQAAFRSGMELAVKNAVVLMDGDLQDPPELIPEFVAKWREGCDVVYGVRVKREAAWYMQIAYKAFYRIFDFFSSVPIPHDAGDFSLIDRRVVKWLLACEERDLFLRGLRAYVGFRQAGVPYVRPERMFGRSTNNMLKNFGWAKKGILSFSRTPLDLLTFSGIGLVIISAFLGLVQLLARLFYPQIAPHGITTVVLLIMFFGSFTIFAISLVGEYIAKIFEEVKARPSYIRRHLIRAGEIRKAGGSG
jgi:nucleoside-diphosphate-sugar epimerase/glycosyltransferase involved in cell wall biosynthesis